MNKTKSFCILPWVHQQIDTNGDIKLCCVSNDKDESFNMKTHTLQDAWNSEFMTDVRQKMLNGERVDACIKCYTQEEKGMTSIRMNSNNEWIDKFTETYDVKVKNNPKYLDLRFGNLCNLKCRMCNPESSSQLLKEWSSIIKDDTRNKDILPYFNHNDIQNWNDNPSAWDSLNLYTQDLEKIYFTGGEPTLIEPIMEFMQKCIDNGTSKNTNVTFTTNATNINNELLSMVTQFKDCHFTVSIDGLKTSQEYIRYPSNWEKIHQNIEKLFTVPNSSIYLSCVVQIYNILELVDFFKFYENYINDNEFKYKSRLDIIVLDYPSHLSIVNLPKSIKEKALHDLDDWIRTGIVFNNWLEIPHWNDFREQITALRQLLNNNDYNFNKDEIERFMAYNVLLDNKRGVKFADVYSELNGLINKELDK